MPGGPPCGWIFALGTPKRAVWAADRDLGDAYAGLVTVPRVDWMRLVREGGGREQWAMDIYRLGKDSCCCERRMVCL